MLETVPGVAALSIGCSAFWDCAKMGGSAVRSMARDVIPDNPVALPEGVAEFERLVGCDLIGGASLIHGTSHSGYRGVGRSMRDAIDPISTEIAGRWRLKPVEGLMKADLKGFILTLGSPDSNALVREVLGCRDHGQGDEIWAYDASRAWCEAPMRFISRRGPPHLKMGDFLEGPRSLCIGDNELPATIHNDTLSSDWLVISVLPHLFDEKAKIISVAGLYGPGTGALRLLLENDRLISDIRRMVSAEKTEFWQVAIPVRDIYWDMGSNRYRPRTLGSDIHFAPVRETLHLTV